RPRLRLEAHRGRERSTACKPDEVEVAAAKALRTSGRSGTGRYVVGEDDVDKALALINVATRGQLVEQLLALPAADELDQPVLGRRRDRLSADQLAAGHSLGEDSVAAQRV